MVHFVGAGSGAADLITVRGARLLEEADVVIYAGSLVNPALLEYAHFLSALPDRDLASSSSSWAGGCCGDQRAGVYQPYHPTVQGQL